MTRLLRSTILILLLPAGSLLAQPFTRADTLRGSNGPGRSWWDARKYTVQVHIDFKDSSIRGSNTIEINTLAKGRLVQVDLQEPMVIDSILAEFNSIPVRKRTVIRRKLRMYYPGQFSHEGNAHFFEIPETVTLRSFTVFYHGKPRVAKMPPWDGGAIWKKDRDGNPWMSVACQGLGASVWYPCKDYQGDEPDAAELVITCADTLSAIGNGRLKEKKANGNGTATWHWAVSYPINSYNLVPYVGKYAHFNETYAGLEGALDMDYWVLEENLEKAKSQFKDAPRMMKAFEYWFGPYPFYRDGYKLVESPHLGMEHQSAIAYGNGYRNGYRGSDLSGSGWGLKWDFIIIHESGHEWFANNISTKDIADMWVHEGFTNYSEVLFTEYYYGKEAASAYLTGLRKNIENDKPVIGPYGVNTEGSGDMYPKGANLVHTLRQVINNDSLFRSILLGLNQDFRYQTVTSRQVEQYISRRSGHDFSKVFDQYLRTVKVPVLEYKTAGKALLYRYNNCVKGFRLPLRVHCVGERWIHPTTQWQRLNLCGDANTELKVSPDFYIITKKVP
jgi:aminopeptidase N